VFIPERRLTEVEDLKGGLVGSGSKYNAGLVLNPLLYAVFGTFIAAILGAAVTTLNYRMEQARKRTTTVPSGEWRITLLRLARCCHAGGESRANRLGVRLPASAPSGPAWVHDRQRHRRDVCFRTF
jgi:hypothetical protein